MASFLKQSKSKQELPEAATGVKQTIQARHGTATFVPKGYSIRIINTYGRQVVDTWAFALHAPPTQEEWNEDNKEDDEEEGEEEDENQDDTETENAKTKNKPQKSEDNEAVEADQNKDEKEQIKDESDKDTGPEGSMVVVEKDQDGSNERQEEQKNEADEGGNEDAKGGAQGEEKSEPQAKNGDAEDNSKADEAKKDEAKSSTEAGEDTVDKGKGKGKEQKQTSSADAEKGDAKTKTWGSYLPSIRGRGKQASNVESIKEEKEPETKDKEPKGKEKESQAATKTWSSYIPSVRRTKKDEGNDKQGTGSQRTWSSYIPSGQGFSSYIKNSDALSTLTTMHQRDPTKSVAEQLYDFSKTPVGAAGISVASGSGYASSLYAAYSAYSTVSAAKSNQNHPGMEFLSMSKSRVSTGHLSPEVGDTLVTNLRAPLLTLVEDRSPGVHDTLIAACDPIRYRELGVQNWAEHGSCAENLVLALQELNKSVGLKGTKAIGSDVTVNQVPTPLNLFMNVTLDDQGQLGFGAPKGQRGDFVKFRAERDVVVVMSACPQDITDINGKKPMVAHFVVESPSEEDKKIANQRSREAQSIIEKARRRTENEKQKRKQSGGQRAGRPPPLRQLSGQRAPPRKLERRASSQSASTVSVPRKESQMVDSPPLRPKQPPPAPAAAPARNKPRKLERRSSTPRPH